MLYKPVVIEHIREEVEGFKTFTFKEGHGIQYKAGQYLTFVQQTTHESIRRSYSIVSSPDLNEPLTIGVKRIENGRFSRELIDHAKIGDELLTIGAGGFFTLPADTSNIQQIFFLAAGSGITPIYSLLKTVLHSHRHIHVVLIYSNSTPQSTIFLEQLNQLSQPNQPYQPSNDSTHQLINQSANQLITRFLFSNSPNLLLARLNRELLAELTRQHSVCNFDEALFYICGPEAYMRMCTYTLQEEGVPKENIRKETFIVQGKAVPKSSPPDHDPHTVTIKYGTDNFQLNVQYPDTILQAAKKQNIILPYSCETGRCGNCVAKCIEGKVWLSYNEVLTDKDLQSGLTLTCVGYPVNGDVLLEI